MAEMLVIIAPSAPAVPKSTVLAGVSSATEFAPVRATAVVATAVYTPGVCAKGAVNVFAMKAPIKS
jgi:hypothetical protein